MSKFKLPNYGQVELTTQNKANLIEQLAVLVHDYPHINQYQVYVEQVNQQILPMVSAQSGDTILGIKPVLNDHIVTIKIPLPILKRLLNVHGNLMFNHAQLKNALDEYVHRATQISFITTVTAAPFDVDVDVEVTYDLVDRDAYAKFLYQVVTLYKANQSVRQTLVEIIDDVLEDLTIGQQKDLTQHAGLQRGSVKADFSDEVD